jgi:hypothetical protein
MHKLPRRVYELVHSRAEHIGGPLDRRTQSAFGGPTTSALVPLPDFLAKEMEAYSEVTPSVLPPHTCNSTPLTGKQCSARAYARLAVIPDYLPNFRPHPPPPLTGVGIGTGRSGTEVELGGSRPTTTDLR